MNRPRTRAARLAPVMAPVMAIAGVLPLLAAAPAVHAAAPAGNAGIIALPLMPVVPAAQRSCSAKTASGLGYAPLRPATGAQPGATDFVLVNYIGYIAATGEAFDQGMRSPLPLDGVIPGFSEGVRMMAKGAIHRLCVPSALGYGANAQGPIPANADLVFQIELVDFKSQAELEAMRAAQEQAPAPVPAPAPKP